MKGTQPEAPVSIRTMADKPQERKRPELVAVQSILAQEPSSKITRCEGPAQIHQHDDYDPSPYPLNPFPRKLPHLTPIIVNPSLPDAEWSGLGNSSSDQSRQESSTLLSEDSSSHALIKSVSRHLDPFGDLPNGMHRRRPRSSDHLHQRNNNPRDPDWEFAQHQSSTRSDRQSNPELSVAESSAHAYPGPNSDGMSMHDGGDFDNAFYRLLDAAALVQQVSTEASSSAIGALSGQSDDLANVFNVLSRLITSIRNRRGGAHGTANIMIIDSFGAGSHPEDMEIATGRNQNHPPRTRYPLHESLAIIVRPAHPALPLRILLVNFTSIRSSALGDPGRPALQVASYLDCQVEPVETQSQYRINQRNRPTKLNIVIRCRDFLSARSVDVSGDLFGLHADIHNSLERLSIRAAGGPLAISDTGMTRGGCPHSIANGAPGRPLFSRRSIFSCSPSKRPRRKQCGRTKRHNNGMNPVTLDVPKENACMGLKGRRARGLHPTQFAVASQCDGRECATSWRHPTSVWEHRFCPVSWTDYGEFQKGCDETRRFDSQRSAQVPHEDEWDLIDGNARLKANIHQTWNFDLHWEVIDFLNDQLDDPDKLRSYFVVTGTEDRAWASTCLDYLRKLWPDSGENFLESFIALLKDIQSLGKHQIYRLKVSPNLNFRVHTNSSNRTLRFCGYATGHDTVTLMRQLAWIVSVCRVPQDGRLLLSRACIQPNGSERQFSIKVEPLKLAPKTGGSCWHEMFVGYVLAYGFPIPARDFGLGVEMPFDIMTILGLVCYPINYGAGLVLKGDNTALIPSKESSGSNAIQWHFVRSSSADSALSWDSISRRCGPEDVFCETNWKRLADKRAFVGYFPKAEVHLGTDDSGFAHIKPSGAPIDDKRRFNFVNEITGSFGTSGLGIFGGGVSGKAVFHRLSEQRIKTAHGMFWNKLGNAKTQPLLLFDTSTKRGWLVPELSGVLHIALTWASTAEDPAVLAAFDRAQISTDGGSAAYSAIQKASTNSLPGVEDDADFDKEMKVRDIVKRVLESLGQIKEQQQQVAHFSGTLTDGLTGYEYVDIAHFQDNLAAKRVKLDGSCTGDWLKVVKKWPEIAVLLCANLGEPVRPAANEAPCHLWTTVPENTCFMTAVAPCMKHMAQRSGGQSGLRIFNELHCTSTWTSRQSRPCLKAPWPCCNPLFEVKSRGPLEHFELGDEAAIIFGRSTKQLCRRMTAKPISNHGLFHRIDRAHTSPCRFPPIEEDSHDKTTASCKLSTASTLNQPTTTSDLTAALLELPMVNAPVRT